MTIMTLPAHVHTTPTSVLDQRVTDRGKCVGSNDDAFHDPANEGDDRLAAALCSGCPVIAECLEAALRREAAGHFIPFGVYGGKTPQERKRINGVLAVAS